MKNIKRGAFMGALAIFFSGVISCEKDFKDLKTKVISNTKFVTNDTILEVIVTQREITSVRGDNVSVGSIGEFLLGVYSESKGHYEKIDASFVSQLLISAEIDKTQGASTDTIITSVFDNAFIKLPYTATNTGTVAKPKFTLDSVLGTTTTGVTLKVFQNLTFLNTLDPGNPAQGNSFQSDFPFDFDPNESLIKGATFTFIPSPEDTIYEYNRNYNGGTFKDTLKLAGSNPFLVIPLDSTKLKSLFYDRFDDPEFDSQEAFNSYFKGLIIEASGSENSLVPFSFSSTLRPSLEINYTNELERISTGEKDTIRKTASFTFAGVQSRIYNMTPEVVPAETEQVIIQGAAGKQAVVNILEDGQLDVLRAKKWLINDAELTFYIDKDRDMTAIPLQLFLYKEEPTFSSQIKDTYSEGLAVFSGVLKSDDENEPDHYSFKITDYISDVLGEANSANSPLILKVYNTTDNPLQLSALDTIVTNYSWNPRAVTLTNHLPSNGEIKDTRKAQLKISYSKSIE